MYSGAFLRHAIYINQLVMNVIAILSTNLSAPRQSDEAYPPTAGTSKQTGCDRPAQSVTRIRSKRGYQ